MKRRILTSLMVFTLACASSEETPPGTGGPTTGGNTTGNPGSGGASNTGGGGDSTGGNAVGAGGNAAGAGGNVVGAGGNATGGSAGTAGNGAGGGMVVNSACGKLQPAQTSDSVLTRGKNPQRTAHFIVPALTLAAVGSAKVGPDATFNATAKLTGNLQGVPLFVAGATPGKGMYIVASTGGGASHVTAIDETTGAVLWTRNMGTSGAGVRSTPVIDATTGT